MSFQKVDAGRGVEWLKQGVNLIIQNPVAFLVMALILGIIMIIPFLGSLALAVLGPTLMAGLAYAAREQANGRKADIAHLFRGFQEEGRIGQLLLLCLPGIAAGVLVAILAFVLIGGAILGAGAAASAGSNYGSAGALGGGMLILGLISLVVVLAAYSLVIFAIPRVMFDRVEAFAAMKESLAATLANIVPLLVLSVIIFVAYLVCMVLLVIPVLGWILWFVILLGFIALNGTLLYLMYRDIFGDASAAPGGYMPPPVPPVG